MLDMNGTCTWNRGATSLMPPLPLAAVGPAAVAAGIVVAASPFDARGGSRKLSRFVGARAAGVAAVFGPGTNILEAASEVLDLLTS